MNKLYAIFAAGLMPIASFAAIDLPVYSVDQLDGLYLNPDLSSVDASYTIDLGFFGSTTLDTLLTLTSTEVLDVVDTDFVSFAQFNFLSNGTLDGSASSTYSGDIPAGSTPGDRIYAYVMDSTGNLVGLFTSDNEGAAWTMPADNTARSLFLTAGTPLALVGSIDSGANGVLEVVPEPSTYAFMAGLMTLGLVVYRRRRA